MEIVLLPACLQHVLMAFMEGTWLWVPVCLLLLGLWLMVTITAWRFRSRQSFRAVQIGFTAGVFLVRGG